jgi:hypothetical protein
MFMAKMEVLHVTPSERGELQSNLRKHNLPASVAQRDPQDRKYRAGNE